MPKKSVKNSVPIISFLQSPTLNPPRYFRILTSQIPELYNNIYRAVLDDYDNNAVVLDTLQDHSSLTRYTREEVQEVFPINWEDKKNVQFFELNGYVVGKNDWIEEKVGRDRYRRLCVQYAEYCRGRWHLVAVDEFLRDFVPFALGEPIYVVQKVIEVK